MIKHFTPLSQRDLCDWNYGYSAVIIFQHSFSLWVWLDIALFHHLTSRPSKISGRNIEYFSQNLALQSFELNKHSRRLEELLNRLKLSETIVSVFNCCKNAKITVTNDIFKRSSMCKQINRSEILILNLFGLDH